MLPLQVLTVLLVAVVMGLTLAHALEFPGKIRLGREEYLVTQAIYYPGFTIGGGIGEVLGIITTLILLVLTPRNNPAFWWTVVAFIAVTATHVVFWVITQPVNRYWVSQLKLPNAAQHFFSVDERDQQAKHLQERWKALRNRWEYSHIIRALLAGIGLIALTVAVAIYR
jgi:Domain of unknown function (DUF1772)